METVKTNKFSELFSKGDFKGLIKRYEKGTFAEEDLKWIAAALCIFGKVQEAKHLFKGIKEPSQVQFFMAIALIRLTKYVEAKKILRLLAEKSFKSRDTEDRFFYYQGLAFYAHFFCRYHQSLYFAQKSFEQTIYLKKSLWKIFSLDLIGHNHVALGNIYKGIHHLQEAKELARLLGNHAFVKATDISLLNYECNFSSKIPIHLKQVERKIKNLSAIDNYSRIVLLLTEAKLEILGGQMNKAASTLRKAFNLISREGSNRHLGQYYFLLAYYNFLQDQDQVALENLEVAEKFVTKDIELTLYLKILGLRYKIISSLGLKDEALKQQVVLLSHKLNDSRSQARLYRMDLIQAPYTEDPLQHLFDQFFSAKWKESLPKLIDYGYHGLLREKLKNKSTAYAMFGIKPKSVLFLSKEGTHLSQDLLSPNLFKLLNFLLTHHRVSKESICLVVWNYSYDPLRHDSSIYALIHRLREILGPYSKYLVGEDHHYTLELSFEILDLSIQIDFKPVTQGNLQSDENWNIRQQKSLSHFARGEFLKVSDYARIHQVTTMTALRDLRELVDKKMITKYGRARSTIYGM